MNENLKKLSEDGVSIWLDDLSRDRIHTGNLAGLIRDKNVVGVTTNPTIFQKAISGSDTYNPQIAELAVRRVTVEEAIRMITTRDVRDAADVLRPVYDQTGGVDGRVSIEVDPRLAHRTDATIAVPPFRNSISGIRKNTTAVAAADTMISGVSCSLNTC